MTKEEFLIELRSKLQGLPKDEIEERVEFYSEMIDDRIEEGKTEEEAIADLGGTDEAVKQIATATPMATLVKERIRPKRSLRAFEIVLLILGFPLWFPLLIVFGVLILVAFILLWVLVIVSYSVEIGLFGTSAAGAIRFFAEIMTGNFNVGYLAISILSIGAAALFFIICYYATKLSIKITKGIILSIKSKLIGGKKND